MVAVQNYQACLPKKSRCKQIVNMLDMQYWINYVRKTYCREHNLNLG